MHAHADTHWVIVKHILHYLKSTVLFGLHVTLSYSFALHGFKDFDWAGSVDNRKSTCGYLIFFGNTLISWKLSKQRTIAHSSIEAKYKTLADDTIKVIWL